MSAAQKRLLDQDPDYESVSVHAQRKRLRLHEQDAKETTIRTVEQIIKTQFSQEISTREAELDTINQRIYNAQTLLDNLRASVIARYYAARGQLLNEQGHGDCPPSARIHPTIKKHLSKTVPSGDIPQQEEEPAGPQGTMLDKMPLLSSKGVKAPEVQVMSIKHTSQGPRFKNKIRVMVGNVSKYISSDKRDPNDHSTHKWMVYVQCPPGGPQIGEVVHKVRFFLHPSYRPNDLVEISELPFHLVRKGWGEFPLRVQLHFIDRRNKPVDIIHNLKLDKTYSGLQTLGAETVVDLWTCCTGGSHTQGSSRENSICRLSQSTDAVQKSSIEQETSSRDTSSKNTSRKDTSNQNSELKSEVPEVDAVSSCTNGDVSNATKTGTEVTNVSSVPLQSALHSSVASAENQLLPVIRQSVIVANSQSDLLKQYRCKVGLTQAQTPSQNESMKSTVGAETPTPTKSGHQSPVTSNWCSAPTATTATAKLIPIHPKLQLSTSALPDRQRTQLPAGKSLLILNRNSKSTLPLPKQTPVNGVHAQSFVKCKDALGRVLLIPSASLLKPAPQLKPPECSSPGHAASASPKVPSVLESSVVRPILPRNPVCPTAGVPRTPSAAPMPSPAVSPLSALTSGHASASVPAPAYTLLVVPRVDKAQSQILLVPTNLLMSKAARVEQPPAGNVAAVQPGNETKGRDRNEAKELQARSCRQQAVVHKVEVLKKTIESIRLGDYKDYSDAMLTVASLFPLTDVDEEEKQACFPYASTTAATYLSWPLPKRRASEWLRAVAVKKTMSALVNNESPLWASSVQSWSTKRVMLWCRKFGFTPLHDADIPVNKSRVLEYALPGDTYSDPKSLLADLEKELPSNPSQDETEEEVIDVEAVDVSPTSKKRKLLSCSPGMSSTLFRVQLPLSPCAQFIKETASEVGVYTSLVEVEPSVDAPVVEEVILAACKRFASTVLRHSVRTAYERTEKNVDPDMVKAEDVHKSVLDLNFCDFLTNSSLGTEVVRESMNEATHL